MKYKCKYPLIVDAVKFSLSDFKSLPNITVIFDNEFLVTEMGLYIENKDENTFTMIAHDGDYVIKDSNDKVGIMDKENFENVYEPTYILPSIEEIEKQSVNYVKLDKGCVNCIHSRDLTQLNCMCNLFNRNVIITRRCPFFSPSE